MEKYLNKIIPFEALSSICEERKNQKMVFTNGCFDILHFGHVHYLAEARKLGDFLVLGLNSDASVKRLKGESRPINGENERAAIMAALEMIDYVVIFEEDTPYNLIKALTPNVLVKGGDYTIENIVGADIVKKNGGLVTTIPFVVGFSSSKIIKKIQ